MLALRFEPSAARRKLAEPTPHRLIIASSSPRRYTTAVLYCMIASNSRRSSRRRDIADSRCWLKVPTDRSIQIDTRNHLEPLELWRLEGRPGFLEHSWTLEHCCSPPVNARWQCCALESRSHKLRVIGRIQSEPGLSKSPFSRRKATRNKREARARPLSSVLPPRLSPDSPTRNSKSNRFRTAPTRVASVWKSPTARLSSVDSRHGLALHCTYDKLQEAASRCVIADRQLSLEGTRGDDASLLRRLYYVIATLFFLRAACYSSVPCAVTL